MNYDFASIGDTKQLLVMTVNKTDAPFGFLHVTVQPVFHITVAIKIVFSLIGVQAKKISIFLGINADTVIVLFGLHFALRSAITVVCKRFAVMKNIALFAEGIDNVIKL